MLKKDTQFKKLKLGGRGWTNNATYWLGPDHLLVVEVGNYAESYRRLYFRDIQSVIIQDNRHQMFTSAILIVFAALGGLFMAVLGPGRANWDAGDTFLLVCLIVFTLAMVAMLIRNLAAGKTCSVHVQTAVQIQKLKNLYRRRSAEKLMGILNPLILQAQSSVVPQAEAKPTDAPPETPSAPAEPPPA